ncbi:Lrp/AsnC ligand binding domain-containing protein [Nitrosopumilus sp. S6]
MQAYVLVTCIGGSESKIISEFKEIPEVLEINGIWGKYDILLKIASKEEGSIDTIIHKLRNHPDVTDTYTMHVLYGQGGSIDK